VPDGALPKSRGPRRKRGATAPKFFGYVFSEVFDLKPTSGLYLKNSAHLSNFLTPRTVSALLNRPVVLRTRSYRTLRDGSFEGTLFQALRARLRSVVPTGRAGRHFAPASSAKACCENVPEGRRDRSLARSAWKNGTQKSRPVGYGVIEYEGRRREREGLGQGAKQIQG
jgi:hypothetical protein